MKTTYAGQTIDLAEIVREIMRPERLPLYDPWFERYHRWLGEDAKLESYIRYIRTLLAQAGVRLAGSRVLDAGCGFGLTALFVNLLGAGEVHGLDCHAGMIRTFETYLEFLPYPLHVYPRLGDVASLPYADREFDLVLSIEAISHYRDVGRFLDEAARVLRPGGTLIIADGNNVRHGPTRRKTGEIWAAFENGPATTNVHGHRVEKPFVQMRQELIAERYPALSASVVERLSRETSGCTRTEVLDAARRYVEHGVLPGRLWDGTTCPLDPLNDYYIENLMDPLQLAGALRRRGFVVRVRPYFGGARGGLVARANALLSQPALATLTLRFTPSFRILAGARGGVA